MILSILRSAFCATIVLCAIAPTTIRAQQASSDDERDLAASEKALGIISNTADRLCNVVKTEGTNRGVKVEGEIKAQLSGALKQLTDAGFKGSGDLTETSYQGLVQDQLLEGIKNNANCKLKVFESLQEKMVKGVRSPGPRTNRDGLREVLEDVRTAHQNTTRRSTAGAYGDRVTYELVIDDGKLTVTNVQDTRSGNLADVSRDIEVVNAVQRDEPQGEKGYQFLRLNCRMNDCFTSNKNGKVTKHKNANIYLLVDKSALPFKQALTKLLQYY